MTTTPNTIRVEAASIGTAGNLQRALLEQLDTSGPVRLEIGTLERIDTATLQLLAAFIRELTSASRAVEWAARSEVLEQAARSLGLTAALALPAAQG
jgi:ABC-type transporter Mla MlaB component